MPEILPILLALSPALPKTVEARSQSELQEGTAGRGVKLVSSTASGKPTLRKLQTPMLFDYRSVRPSLWLDPASAP